MFQAGKTRKKRATVVFDGNCGLCRAGAAMLARVDGGRHFDFVSLDDALARELLRHRSHEDLMREMHVALGDGRWCAGAEAIRAIAIRVPFLWCAVPLLYFPGSLSLWRKLYAAIANRRYRISAQFGCEGGSCAAHHGRGKN